MKNKNIPQLRFSEFTGEWQEKKLGDICDFQQGIQVDIDKQYKQQNKDMIRFIRIENYTQNSNDYRYIPKSKVGNKYIDKDEIAVVRYGATAGYIGKGKEGILANNLFKVKPDRKFLDNDFLYKFLKSYRTFRYFQSEMTGGAMPALSFEIIGSLKINYPLLLEQEKIAEFLGAVDEKIEKLEDKKKKFEKYKTGIMQAIFSQKIRFRDENGKYFPDWEEKKLSHVLELFHGYQFRTSDFTKSGIAIIKIANVIGNKLDLSDLSFISHLRYEEFKRYEINRGDILMSLTGNIGRVIEVTEMPFKLMQNYRVGKFIPIKNLTIKKFAKYLLMSKMVFGRFGQLSNQSAQANFGKQDMNKIRIKMPEIEEQEKIAEFLAALDNKVDLINKKLGQAKLFKKSLLQRMFV